MSSNRMIFTVIVIGLQVLFVLETDMVIRLNVMLCSYAVFSGYTSIQKDYTLSPAIYICTCGIHDFG